MFNQQDVHLQLCGGAAVLKTHFNSLKEVLQYKYKLYCSIMK